MSDSDDLAPLLEELADTLERLRDDVGGRRPRRVRDLLRFTERYTIPAVIAVLETNIRLLELTAGAIRLADGRLDEREAGSGRPAATDALERALDDLGGALRGTPTDPDARELLAEARDLRREIRGRLADGDASGGTTDEAELGAETEPGDGTERTGGNGGSGRRVPVREETDDPAVDVDAELETIRRQLGEESPASDATDDGPSGEN